MAQGNIARTNQPLGTRMLNGVRNLLGIGARHQVSRAYPRLTVQNLFRPLSMQELFQLDNYLSEEHLVRSEFFSREGALVRLNPEREQVLIGDLHGNTARLERILQEYGPRLATGEVSLIFLGDIIHPEELGNTSEMRSSLEALNTVIRLKQQFPEQVHLLLGNHDVVDSDNFQMNEAKRGLPQSVFFNIHLSEFFENLGFQQPEIQRMIAGYQLFFDNCPLAMIVEGETAAVYASHAGVVRGGVTQRQLVNARSDPGFFRQLLTNRYADDALMAKLRSSGSDGRYFSDADLDATLNGLSLRPGPSRTYVVCGHTPEVDRGWLYQPIRGRNMWVAHSNIPNTFGVVVVSRGAPRGVPITLDPNSSAAV